MELNDATNAFVGSASFTTIVIGGILLMGIFLRLLFGAGNSEYRPK